MAKQDQTLRLNKYLADCGIASRRKADELIEDGQVQVNGKTVYELGVRVDPSMDRITLNGKPVKPPTQKVYIVFYKPESVVTSMADPQGRPTVADFMPADLPYRVFPVGRLDWDSEGLLLLTNDGEFSQKVTHPKEDIPKTYMVKLDGKPTDQQLQKLLRGVTIPGGRVAAKHVERARISSGGSDQYDWIKIVITEGKNRQVRHMFAKIGYDVKKLKRTAIGQLTLGPLKKGEHAFLDERGIKMVFKQSKLILFKEGQTSGELRRKKPVEDADGKRVRKPLPKYKKKRATESTRKSPKRRTRYSKQR